jgi:hypothetical protein
VNERCGVDGHSSRLAGTDGGGTVAGSVVVASSVVATTVETVDCDVVVTGAEVVGASVLDVEVDIEVAIEIDVDAGASVVDSAAVESLVVALVAPDSLGLVVEHPATRAVLAAPATRRKPRRSIIGTT